MSLDTGHTSRPAHDAGTPHESDTDARANAAEAIDEAAEEAYWSTHYASRPYARSDVEYDYYRPAYRFGWESRCAYPRCAWEDVRDNLRQNWMGDPANFQMPWEDAEAAVLDAWERVGAAWPGRFTTT
jgi:hypothetical protein